MPVMRLQVMTVERIVLSAEADSVTATSVEGQITILPGHIPLVSLLQPGELTIRRHRTEQVLFVSGGFLQVSADEAIVLADACEYAEEIDLERAEAARQRAQELLAAGGYDIDAVAAEAALRRSLARIRVASLRKRSPNSRNRRFE